MKLLLTSAGIKNTSIANALVEMLGKPIAEAGALVIPTAAYPAGGPAAAWRIVSGHAMTPLCEIGWKSVGLLELTALPSIDAAQWIPIVRETDALLVGGGDPLYLAYWFEQTGLAEVLTSLNKDLVYVGVSAGSMAVNVIFGETYSNPRGGSGTPLTTENVVFNTGEGDVSKTIVIGKGAGLTDFSVIPHFNNPAFQDSCGLNAEKWAATIPAAVYAIDEQTAIKVVAGQVEIVSEGQWKFFSKLA